MKQFKWIIIILFLILIGCTGMQFKYQGIICKDIMPSVGGEFRIIRANNPQNNQILIYDNRTPANIEFADFKPPATAEEAMNFNPPFKEAWMGDLGQDLNHESNRLIISDLKGNYKILFQEFGQNGWWWISKNLQTIYILVYFLDYTKAGKFPKEAISQMHYWASFDGGKTFRENPRFLKSVGTGYASDMVFDKDGSVGYIFFNKNIVWKIIDGGLKFQKYYIPHTLLKPFPIGSSTDGVNKDAAMVDNHSNLLYALFQPMKGEQVGANIYEIPEEEPKSDLIQQKPKYSFPGKRILAMHAIPDKDGFYMFYMECGNNKNCNWHWEEEKWDQNTEPLHFAQVDAEGHILHEKKFPFFMIVKKIYTDKNGSIAVSLNHPNSGAFKVVLSYDYGKSWLATDLSNRIGSEYIDFDHKEFWYLSREGLNRMFMDKLP